MKIINSDAYSLTVETTTMPYELEQILTRNNFKVSCFPSLSVANRININFENYDKQRLETFLNNLN